MSGEQLAALAAERRDLWNEIWHHPNCYDELRQWMSAQYTAQAEGLPQSAAPMVEQYPFGGVSPLQHGQAGVPPALAARPKRGRRTGLVVAASIVAALIALTGTGAALALTGTWPFGTDGPMGAAGGSQATVAGEMRPQSFADGAEVKWTLTGEDLGSGAELVGHLPRMMGPINQANRPDQPIQLQSGVLVHYRGDAAGGDVPASWALLDPENGAPIWTEEGGGYPSSCATDDGLTRVTCSTSFIDGATLIGLEAEGIRFIEDAELGAVLSSGSGATVLSENEVSEFSGDGALGDTQSVDGISAGTVGNARTPDCVWLYGAGSVSYAGSGCTAPAEEILTDSDSFNWAVIDEGSPKILIDEISRMTVFDARTRAQLWSIDATLPGWFQSPQLVQREGGPALLVQRAEGNTPSYSIVDIESGEEITLEARWENRDVDMGTAVVSGDEVLVFGGAPPYGDPVNYVLVFDPETGELKNQYDIPPVENVAEIIGGPNGVLFGHPHCTDCSTAEGSHVIDRYTFMAPAGTQAETAGDGTTEVAYEVPDFIPDCPGETILLAWMEVEDGWIVVCGYTVGDPVYIAYAPAAGGKVRYSLGASKPESDLAQSSVQWDASQQRYTAAMADGSKLTLDYTTGTATLRDGKTDSTVEEQHRFIRYVFVPIGTEVRGIKDSAGRSGAFDVSTPEETAEDQVRYMVEVLERSYEGRALVKTALPKLQGCTAGAGGYVDSIEAMETVRDNRATLLAALDAMPVDKIPEGKELLADLSEAIANSHEANIEYVAWAESANASGCASLSDRGVSYADASQPPKERFAERWNRAVAPAYGVRTFDASYI